MKKLSILCVLFFLMAVCSFAIVPVAEPGTVDLFAGVDGEAVAQADLAGIEGGVNKNNQSKMIRDGIGCGGKVVVGIILVEVGKEAVKEVAQTYLYDKADKLVKGKTNKTIIEHIDTFFYENFTREGRIEKMMPNR